MLLREAPRLIAHARLLESTVVRTASDVSRLAIGFVEPALYRVIPSIMPRFRERWPGLEVFLDEMPSAEQLARLQDGRLDLGFVMMGSTDLEGLQFSVVERSPIMLAVPVSSPLAARRQVRLEEVAKEAFIMQSREANPATYNAIVALCREAGFTPRAVQETNHAFTILKFVASGLGVGFAPEMAAELDVKGVKLLRIADHAFDFVATLCIVWARQELPAEAREFIRMAEASGRGARKAARTRARS
jgi:DNA-binding transcriptional LysR family regulator